VNYDGCFIIMVLMLLLLPFFVNKVVCVLRKSCVILGFCKGWISEYRWWLLWYNAGSYTVCIRRNWLSNDVLLCCCVVFSVL